MRVRFIRSGFSVRQNLLPLALGVLWLFLLAGLLQIGIRTGTDANVCWFKHLAGFNCPTCGTSRIVLSLWHLRPLQAFLINPLAFVFLIIFTLYLILRIIFKRDLRLIMSKRESRLFWSVLALLFVANWTYVILTLK